MRGILFSFEIVLTVFTTRLKLFTIENEAIRFAYQLVNYKATSAQGHPPATCYEPLSVNSTGVEE